MAVNIFDVRLCEKIEASPRTDAQSMKQGRKYAEIIHHRTVI